ncbi:serine/threonine-protein kinase BUR1-like isoform X5 [Varroa destructor]|uniref:Serine/threonine-protein kinase greatwall n=1 Tax=Varroa destructor TaxID=109461 RepID=A0A7M7J9M0_VARDE|nr:serine/threonine-protein kinase BUR1-like isoform X5 [Varroa destructor]
MLRTHLAELTRRFDICTHSVPPGHSRPDKGSQGEAGLILYRYPDEQQALVPYQEANLNITNQAATFDISKLAATDGASKSGQSVPASDWTYVSNNVTQGTSADVYKELRKACPNVIRVALIGLEEYTKGKKYLDPQLEPQEQYVREQVTLSLKEVGDLLRKERLKLEDIRETIENLFGLLEHLFVIKAFKAALMCRNKLVRGIYKVEDLAKRLEGFADPNSMTDWQGIRESLCALPIDVGADGDLMAFVPPISLFRSKGLLGVGGFGAVYRARFGRSVTVTVKLVAKDRFASPFVACTGKLVGSMINHALLVRQFACFETAQAYVTVMELIDGVEVRDVTRAVGGLPVNMNKLIIGQLCLGLRYLHHIGFIHRDVKPANMMITSGVRVKLIDFDTSKVSIGMFIKNHPLNNFYRRTVKEIFEKEAIGTIPFMPPEILRGKPFGRTIDWWAVGVTVYNLHTNTYPFLGKGYDVKKTQKKIIKGTYTWPKSKSGPPPQEMVDLVKDFLKKRPEKRLCSKDYAEIENHPFFADFEWAKWDSGTASEEWVQLDKIITAQKLKRAKENQSAIKNTKKTKETKKTKKSRTPLRLRDLTPARKQTPLHTTFSLAFRMAVRRLRAEGKLPANALDEPVDFDGTYQASNTEGHTYLIRQLRYKVHRDCNHMGEQDAIDQIMTADTSANKSNDPTSKSLNMGASRDAPVSETSPEPVLVMPVDKTAQKASPEPKSILDEKLKFLPEHKALMQGIISDVPERKTLLEIKKASPESKVVGAKKASPERKVVEEGPPRAPLERKTIRDGKFRAVSQKRSVPGSRLMAAPKVSGPDSRLVPVPKVTAEPSKSMAAYRAKEIRKSISPEPTTPSHIKLKAPPTPKSMPAKAVVSPAGKSPPKVKFSLEPKIATISKIAQVPSEEIQNSRVQENGEEDQEVKENNVAAEGDKPPGCAIV